MDRSANRPDLDRRNALHVIGSVIAVGLFGCGGDGNSSPSPASPSSSSGSTSVPSTNAPCVVTPALIEGPAFVDERLNRSDIRSDPATGIVKAGVPLTLTVQLSQISSAGACTALAGAMVDIWHCDALGLYSDVGQTAGQKFLRGYQLTDASGAVQFTTIFPGWYAGRAVHIHFKVRMNPDSASGLEFTSRMYFDEALTDAVHAQAPYSEKGRRDTTNSNDAVYQAGGTQVLLSLSASGNGYAGTFNVGVRI